MITCGFAALVVTHRAGAQAPSKPQAGAPKSFEEAVPGGAVRLQMIAVPAGTLTKTSTDGKNTPRTVAIKPFYICKTETPWEAFDAFTASGPPTQAYQKIDLGPDAIARPSKSYIPPDLGWGHSGYPVICESFLSATMFCRWLSSVTKHKYRVPTEDEWEYACRAGAAAPSAAEIPKYAWCKSNSEVQGGKQTHPVAKKLPNAWGLYDMLGNTAEWAVGADGNPVVCGGSFETPANQISPSTRARQTPEWQATDPQFPKSRWWLADAPFVGFRIVCEP